MRADDSDGFRADGDDTGEQVEDVTGVAHLTGPVVRIVDDFGCLVGLNLVALNDPLDRGPGPSRYSCASSGIPETVIREL